MQDSRRQFLAAAAAGVTGLFAGCGGSDTGTPTGTDEPTDTESMATDTESMATDTETMSTDTESMTTETESMATESDSMGTPASSQTVTVAPGGSLSFDPDSFEVPVGTTVTWEWDSGGHNVRPDSIPSGSDWSGSEGGDGDTYGSGHTHSHTFEAAGEYSYYCAPHQSTGMTATFTVTQ